MGLNNWLRSLNRKNRPAQDSRYRATWRRWFRPLIETLEDRLAPATLYALTNANALLTFDSATPGTITNNQLITGLQATEEIVGIDVRPATGQLYGFGLVDDGATRTGRIYTINPATGAATQVGGSPWTTAYPDIEFGGFNFNPNVDLIRIISREGPNFRVSPNTGALVGTDTNTSQLGLNGVAYTNNDGFAATTTLYGLNFDLDDLVTVGGLNGVPSPNTGQVFTVGNTGVVALDAYGMEIVSTGGVATAFATEDGNLHTVDLATGALTLVGAIGGAPFILGLTAALPNTIAVGGTAGADSLVVNATGVNSGTYSLNGGAAIAFSGIASFAFIGGGGDDNLTINNPAGGLFAPTGGIRYHGGGQPGDSLSNLGGSATSGTYTPGPSSDAGVLSHVLGGTTQSITFDGLAPVIDTVAEATFTINGNDGANNIVVDNGTSAVDGLIRVAIDAFEPISFSNKTNVTVNGGLTAADVADTIAINFTEVGTGLSALTVNGGEGADAFNINAVAGNATNLNGNAGAETFAFASGASLSGGTIDGGADVDTLNYSAFATGVSVNLGLNASSFFATLQGDQEVPPTPSTANGTATVTYNNIAGTINVTVAVPNLSPGLVTGFHIHRGAFGVNGPVIIDFGTGGLIPDGTGGFTFNGVFALPAGQEAALLGGQLYINVHTAAFPGGLIRGQIFSNGNVNLVSGTATGTAGVSNVENATGGAGNDSLTGSFAANILTGNAGADVIVGGPGTDTMAGNAGNDFIVWANGDGSDIIDGGADVDLVQVNGSPGGNDVFTVGANGTRIDFDRVSPGPFSLDIGTTETLTVIGIGGTDTFSTAPLTGVTDLTTLNLAGLDGDDTYNVIAQTNVTTNINGHLPRLPASPGDTLNFDAAGDPVSASANQFTTPGEQPVNFINIETINLLNTATVVVNGTGANDTLVVTATNANSGSYSLNGGPAINFTGLTSFTFNAFGGDDTMIINNPGAGIFAPLAGIVYNGGGQPNDSIQNLSGGADFGSYQPGPTNDAGVISHTQGATTQTITFTGLAPATDTVAEATFTVNATNAANTITVDDGNALADGLIRVSIDAFEPIEFGNKINVIVEGDPGAGAADTINVQYTEASNLLATLTINARTGPDDIRVFSTPAGVTTNINGNAGNDTITLGSAINRLAPINGPVTVDGGAGANNQLILLDDGAANGQTYTVTGTTVQRAGVGLITYASVQFLELNTSDFDDIINVQGTALGTLTRVNAGLGSDTVNVSSDAPANTGNLDALDGVLEVNSGDALGTDVLNISESGTASADTVLVNTGNAPFEISGTNGGGWSIQDAVNIFGGGINLFLGSGADVVNVQSTFANEPVFINTGLGSDTVNVSSDAPANTGTLDNLDGPLTLDSGDAAGTDVLNISESGTANPDTVLVNTGLAPFEISGTNGGGWSIQDAVNIFGGGINLFLGSGADVVNVQSTFANEPVFINTGLGSDTVNVSSDAPANTGTLDNLDGPLSLDSGDTGGGDVLNISESGSAAPDTVLVDTDTTNTISGTVAGGWSVELTGGDFSGGVNLFLGTAADTANVSSTRVNEVVTIFAGPGDDTINVGGIGGSSLGDVNSPLNVEGEDGNDTLNVDFVNEDITDVLINFNGGAQTATPGDTVNVLNINTDTVTKNFLPQTAGNNGNIDVGGSVINYTGLEPVTLGGTLANLIINLPTGDGDNFAILEDDGDPANGISQIRSGNGSFETTTFTNPTATLTLNTGDDGETVTIAVLDDAFAAAITANGGAGQDTFFVTPAPLAAITINGAAPTVIPGDTLSVDVAGTTNPVLTITNVNGDSLDGNYTFDDRGTVTFTSIEQLVPQGADISVTKTDTPDPVIAGTNLTYTITVSNAGLLTSQNVQLTDATPFGSTFVSFTQGSGPAFTLSDPGVGNTGFVTATIAELQPGQTATFTFVVMVNTSTPDGSTITNTATVLSLLTPDFDLTDNLATTDTLVNTSADLVVTKIDNPDPATAGENLTYTITVINNGPSDAQTVTLSDVLPANTTFVSFTQDSGPGFTLVTPPVGATGLVTGTIASLTAGAIATFTFVVNVNANTVNGTTLDNTVSVASAVTTDPNLLNNFDTELTAVVTEADVVVTKTGTPTVVIAGQNITYTITVTNDGPSDATGILVTDTAPNFTTFVSAATSQGTFAVNNGVVTYDVGTLTPGTSATLTLVVMVNATTPDGTIITNAATAVSNGIDPDTANNTGTSDTTVTNQADLAVTKTGPAFVSAGQDATYTITITNNGPNEAPSVTLSDLLPAGTTFVSSTGLSGVTVVAGLLTGTLGPIASGASAVVTITVNVPANTPPLTVLTDIASAAIATPGVVDPDLTNNAATFTTVVVTTADLAVTKAGLPDPVIAGQNVTYTVLVTNNGVSDALGVILSDALPAGVTLVSATPSQGVVLVSSNSFVQVDLGTIAAGATATMTIVVTTSATTPNGTVINNTAFAMGTTADPNPLNNVVQIGTTVTNQADLAVDKTGPLGVIAGQDATYTITITNNGPNEAPSVTLTDILPAGATFVSSTGLTNVTVVAGTLTGTLGPIASGASAVVTITVNVAANTPFFTTITNTATASLPTSAVIDPDLSNNTDDAQSIVVTQADIQVTKADAGVAVVAGTNLTYTITVTNAGPSDAQNVVLSDAVPPGTTFVSFAQNSGPAGALSTPAVGGTGNVQATIATLAAGATATFTLVVNVAASTPNGVTLSNTANAFSGTADNDVSNNIATETTPVVTQADVSVTKTDTPDPVIAGTNLTYTITVSNAGPSDAQTVNLSDLLPANTTFVSATQGSGPSFTLTTPPVGGTGTFTAAAATLAAGATATFTLVVNVNSNVFAGSTITNTATVTTATTDPVASNDSATATTAVITEADVAVTKTDSPDPVTAGTNLTYTITVTNNGPSDALAATLSDTLPVGTTFVSMTQTSGPAFSLVVPPVGGTGTLSGFLVSMPAGATATFELVVLVGANVLQGATVTNTATVSTLTTDPTPANDSATTTTAVVASADLAVTKTDLPDPVIAGEQLTFTITVTNVGPSDAQSVSLGDLLPAGTTFVSLTAPAGWTTSTPAVGANGLVSATRATLAAGVAPQVFTLVVLVAANVPGGTTISNTATIISLTTDPDLANNNATSITGVNAEADIVVTKSDSPDPVIAGTNLTYTILVRNDGSSDAQNVQFIDNLPAGVVFVSGVASNAAVLTPVGNVVSGNLGTIAANATVTVTIIVTVPANTANGSTLTNTATANSATVDPNPANNSDTETTSVDTQADIAVVKTDSPDPVIAGNNLTYTVTVTNTGPSDAQNVVFTDTLPAGVVFVSATSTQGTVSGTNTVVLGTIGTVASGAVVTLTIIVRVPSSTADGTTLTNTATGTSNTVDPTPANNTDTETTAVIARADLGIVQSGQPNPAVAGGPVTYTITVTNTGPSDGQTVVVTETIPTNTTLISWTQTSGPAFTLNAPPVGGTGNVTATVATLVSGATAEFSLQVRVSSNAAEGSTITKTGTVATTTTDPTPGNNTATATLPVINPEIIAVGPTFGTSEVRVFNARTQAQQMDIPIAFVGWTGGVRTAVADINGDGFEDVIAGPAFAHPGGGHVKVFDGVTGAEVRSFFAFPGFGGDTFVGGGDVNGDGYGDIIVGAGAGAPGGHVKVFSGLDNSELMSFFAFDGFGGGVRVAGGDTDGDGKADIIVSTGPSAVGTNSHVKVFSGTGSGLLASFFAFPIYSGGVFVGSQDINNDGRSDVLIGADAGAGGGHVKVIDATKFNQVAPDGHILDSALIGSFFTQATSFTGGARVSGGILTNGTNAVVTGPGDPSQPVVQLFTGTQFEFPAPVESFFGLDPEDQDGIFVGA